MPVVRQPALVCLTATWEVISLDLGIQIGLVSAAVRIQINILFALTTKCCRVKHVDYEMPKPDKLVCPSADFFDQTGKETKSVKTLGHIRQMALTCHCKQIHFFPCQTITLYPTWKTCSGTGPSTHKAHTAYQSITRSRRTKTSNPASLQR